MPLVKTTFPESGKRVPTQKKISYQQFSSFSTFVGVVTKCQIRFLSAVTIILRFLFRLHMMRVRNNSDSGISSDSVSNNIAPYGCQPPYRPLTLQEKIRYLEEKLITIKSAKETFSENYSIANCKIEITAQSLRVAIQNCELSVRTSLREIGTSKILEWERQMRVCEEAMRKIREIRDNLFEAVDNVQTIADSYAGKIGLIDGGNIGFSLGDWNPLEDLSRFGKLLTSESFSPAKLAPRFILRGREENQEGLSRPWGVCTDLTGRFLVVDSNHDRIQLFNEHGKFLYSFGKFGDRPGEFNHPTGIAVDKKSRILVSDKNNHRIQVFSFTGCVLFTFGQRGVKEGQFLYPWDVAVNDFCDIAVSDSENNRIQLFDPFGAFVAYFRFSNSPTLGICPRGIAFKPDGSVLVTDFNNHSVVLVGKGLTTVSEFRPKNSGFFRPQGISCDARGKFAIADGRHNVQVYDEYGNLQRLIGGFGTSPGDFDNVQGVCLLPDGGIAVTEFGNNRVQVF